MDRLFRVDRHTGSDCMTVFYGVHMVHHGASLSCLSCELELLEYSLTPEFPFISHF